MFGQKPSLVAAYLDRNRLQFYGTGFSTIPVLDIPATDIRDLDVVNRDGIYALINQWLKVNNIGGANLYFVCSPNTYFDKAISATSDSEQETEIIKFYDTVPFEELATKVINIGTTKRAFAMNRQYLEAIQHAFTLQGHRVVAAIPAFVLGTLATKRWLDAEMGLYILKHADELRQYSLLDEHEQNAPVSSPARDAATSKNNPRLMIMVGFFGVLLLVLIVILFTRH